MLNNVKYFVIKLANLLNQPIFIKGGRWRYLNVKNKCFPSYSSIHSNLPSERHINCAE